MEKCYNELYDNTSNTTKNKTKVIPIIPNLATSTDEVTIFACPGKINKSEKIHLVARPTKVKNPKVNSSRRNNYNTTSSGDAPCCGVQIVLNSTFTTDGLSAPLFIVVYRLGVDEVPFNDMVKVKVKGLVAASNRNVISAGDGFVTFMRGKYEPDNEPRNDSENNADDENENHEDDILSESKETRVAELYRRTVYHPFINQICQECYEWDPNGPILENLQAVAWMDGAGSQLKHITKEENLKKEEDLKISILKQSAARTVVE